MLGFIIWLLVMGAIAGFLARLLVPGRDSMSFLNTVVLGIIGSFIGGFIAYAFDNGRANDESALRPSGIVGSVIGAIIALLVYRAVNGRRGVGRSRI